MDPMSVLKEHLGAVATWPTSTKLQLFAEDPSERSVRDVTEFMYGNGVPIRLPIECFDASSGENDMFIDEKMLECYYARDRSNYKLHKAQYSFMNLKEMSWINGRACNRLELLRTNLQVKDFGLEPAACVKLIQCAIDNVREGRGNALKPPNSILFV
jgi:hypothetical protein